MGRKRRAARDQKYDPISFTISGVIKRSHEEDGITIIDEIEVQTVAGMPVRIVRDDASSLMLVHDPAGRLEP